MNPTLSYITCLTLTLGTIPLLAQDRFPTPIPLSGITVNFDEIAVIPDSTTNSPPRVSILTQDPSGRLFACDQRGPLYTIDEATGTVTEYLDLRDFTTIPIISTSEAGFQSFAFHPDFFRTGESGYGKFYTIHSSTNTSSTPDFDPGGNTSFHTLLLEWETSNPASNQYVAANPGPAPFREVIRFKQPFSNHNAGLIAFNPLAAPGDTDYGNLYIAIADGGSGGDPQENGEDPSNPYGAILRIDPLGNNSSNGKYGIVAENTLASDGDVNTLGEIYCYGLRNPQRFAWDIQTGNVYIADIGQNAVEEINLMANGAHFGWDIREGSFDFEGGSTTGLTDPVAEYDHTNTVTSPPTSIGNRAVTTGEVARGTCIDALEGRLLLGDFPTGLIFLLNVDSDPLDGGQDGLTELTLLDADGEPARLLELINETLTARGLSTQSRADLRFSVNTPGRIYITNKRDGVIRKIRPTSLPTISIGMSGDQIEIHFKGMIQEAQNSLMDWADLLPRPASPWIFTPEAQSAFFRAGRR